MNINATSRSLRSITSREGHISAGRAGGLIVDIDIARVGPSTGATGKV